MLALQIRGATGIAGHDGVENRLVLLGGGGDARGLEKEPGQGTDLGLSRASERASACEPETAAS